MPKYSVLFCNYRYVIALTTSLFVLANTNARDKNNFRSLVKLGYKLITTIGCNIRKYFTVFSLTIKVSKGIA